MNKRKDSFENANKNAPLNSTDRDELLDDLDMKRRSFLKKLLISATYVTPAILSFSVGDLEARAKKLPTKKKKKKKK